MRKPVVALLVLLFLSTTAHAQYFGRNKVQWEHFDFKIVKTEHFDIYYYDREADVVNDIGRMAERWYARYSRVFNHTFTRKPIVLYANAADFQQTTTTPELIGQGTGGFTDPFMNRVVMPLTGDYAENDHVLGHELVHVFQFDIANKLANNRRRFNLEALPLWLVEGMAEYFSKGRIDPLTAMWIRDATSAGASAMTPWCGCSWPPGFPVRSRHSTARWGSRPSRSSSTGPSRRASCTTPWSKIGRRISAHPSSPGGAACAISSTSDRLTVPTGGSSRSSPHATSSMSISSSRTHARAV
jgi:hypothetical protein